MGFWVEFKDRVFETAGAECYDWRACAEKLVLDYASRFEHRGHHGEITADVDQRPIAEKLVRIAPKTLRVFLMQKSHLFCTIFTIILFAVSHSSHQKLDLIIALMNQRLNCLEDEMDSFLSGDSTNEREKWHVFGLVAVEIFLLELEFGLLMSSWGFGSEDAQSLLFSDAIGKRERMRVPPQYRGKIRFLKQFYFV